MPLCDGRKATKKDMIDRNTLVECDYLPVDVPISGPGSKATSPVAQLLVDLQVAQGQNTLLSEEIKNSGEVETSQAEVLGLKNQMILQ